MKREIESIAIGGFDGMHRAHQELFKRVGLSGAIVVIESGHANLTPYRERERHTELPVIYLQLDEIRHFDAEGFLDYLSQQMPLLRSIVVGYDFHFGRDRAYDIDDLRDCFDGKVVVVDEFMIDHISVHSHKIREFLGSKKIELASRLLGYHYTYRATVVRGQGIGSKELVATINAKQSDFLLPKDGVYATLSQLDDEDSLRASITFIGRRATTDDQFAIETHLLDTTVTTSTQKIAIKFLKFIRDGSEFKDNAELKQQIEQDIEQARAIFAIIAL